MVQYSNFKKHKQINGIKLFVIIVTILCNVGYSEAQRNEDQLKPVDGIFGIFNFQYEYGSKVRKVLLNGLTDKPEIRFLVIPSFTPEIVLDIESKRDSNKYYIVHHICKAMIWSDTDWEKIKVVKYKSEIDKESVQLVKSLFEIATSKVKYPERIINSDGSEKFISGLDGVNYYFSIYLTGHGIRSGTVWSPNEESKMGKLVAIGNKMIELAKSGKEKVSFDTEFKKSIENLIIEFKQ